MLAGNSLLAEMRFAFALSIAVAAFGMAVFFTPQRHRRDRTRRVVARPPRPTTTDPPVPAPTTATNPAPIEISPWIVS